MQSELNMKTIIPGSYHFLVTMLCRTDKQEINGACLQLIGIGKMSPNQGLM